MADDREPVLMFLADMGIEGRIILFNHERLIVISTEQYKQRQRWIETWFTLVEQREDDCYFRERLRGTGQTL